MPLRLAAQLRNDLQRFFEPLGLALDQVKADHYARNDHQATDVSYVDIILGDFQQMPDAKAVYHKLNKKWDKGNLFNSKWVSTDDGGHQEYVFRYEGDAATGGFRLVTKPLNVGSYNFKPSGPLEGQNKDHFYQDIVPWILWGNTEQDAENWSARSRAQAFVGKGFDGLVGSVVTKAAVDFITFDQGFKRKMSGGDDIRKAWFVGEKFLGGAGNDTVSYQSSKRAVTANLEKDQAGGYDGHAKGDSYSSIENLTGSNWGDILVGDGKANVLKGLKGSDWLIGGDGKNTIEGGKHDDFIFGGSGKDTLNGDAGNDRIFGDFVAVGKPHGEDKIDGGDGNDWVQAGGAKDIVQGGKGKDTLYGGYGDDEIDGGEHSDEIFGEAGDDTIILKHAAPDTVDAGEGDDTIVVEKGYKHVIDGGAGWDIVDLRGLDLDKLDVANFSNVEEIWVDDVLITPVALNLGKVKVFGDQEVRFSVPSGEETWHLFGSVELELALDARLELSFKASAGDSFLSKDYKRTDQSWEQGQSIGFGSYKEQYDRNASYYHDLVSDTQFWTTGTSKSFEAGSFETSEFANAIHSVRTSLQYDRGLGTQRLMFTHSETRNGGGSSIDGFTILNKTPYESTLIDFPFEYGGFTDVFQLYFDIGSAGTVAVDPGQNGLTFDILFM